VKKCRDLTMRAAVVLVLLFASCPSTANLIPRTLRTASRSGVAQSLSFVGACVLGGQQASRASTEDDASSAALEAFLEGGGSSTRVESAAFLTEVQRERPLCSDEFIISFDSQTPSLGLGLEEKSYQGFPVAVVREVRDEELARAHPELRIGAIVSSINKESVDGIPLSKIGEIVQRSKQQSGSLSIKFRDPSRYFELLDSTIGKPLRLITSSYLPANARDAGAAEQIIYVERLELPPPESRRRSAQYLDVMELQYVAQLASSVAVTTGGGGDDVAKLKIVDSSAERAPPGTSAQSIYYVLGQQNGPPGFPPPPGWDLTLRGMVVGEKRRITLPYTLAYERKGDKNRKIPPFATLIYTVKLLSLT